MKAERRKRILILALLVVFLLLVLLIPGWLLQSADARRIGQIQTEIYETDAAFEGVDAAVSADAG